MDLHFQVRNQKLESIDQEFLVNLAHNYHVIYIDFITDDWDGRALFVVLKNAKQESYLFNYRSTGIVLPATIVEGNKFKISCYGVDNNQSRITTNELSISLNTAGYTTDISEVPEEEMDIIADIYLQLDTKVNISDVESELDINSSNPVKNSVVTGNLNLKSDIGHKHSIIDLTDFPNFANVALSGSYNDLSNKPTIYSLGGDVAFERQTTPDTGYLATYVLKQGGTAVGDKLQIPKDYLLKSAEIKVCTTPNMPVYGYRVGDVYFDLVFNTKDQSGTDTHQYFLANILKDVYDADNQTLQKSNNNIFSVKNGGIGTTQLSTTVNTLLGYAEAYNNSAAKNIVASDLVYWNGKQDVGNLVTSFGSTLSDSKYPSEKLVKNYVDNLVNSRIGDIQSYINR